MTASSPRIVLLGATGYTGDLTARSLVRQGARPVLVARNRTRVEALAAELGDLDTAIADVTDAETVRAVLQPGDVLISTVGPFLKYGRAVVQTAAETGAHYLDSTGEGPFVREVFERWGSVADRNGVALLPACGYDYVPGALAAALALEEAGPAATAVGIGYFSTGVVASGGTRASAVRVLLEEGFTFRSGHIQPERAGRHLKQFQVAGRSLVAASIPAAEHFGLPQSYPQVRDITVMLGLPRAAARALAFGSLIVTPVSRIAPLSRAIRALADRAVTGSTGGPDASERARATTTVIAIASSPEQDLATVTLTGPNPYEVTADILAWGAITAGAGGLQRTGSLGPVSAFGLDAVARGCALAGMSVAPGTHATE